MDYAVVICTPYSVQKGIVDDILEALDKLVVYKTLMRKMAKLTVEDVEIMYPRLVNHPVFANIVECLTGGEVECVLVTGVQVHERINDVKGKFRYVEGKAEATGLRQQFQKDDQSFEFIFHSTDSNRESDEIAVRLFGEEFFRATG